MMEEDNSDLVANIKKQLEENFKKQRDELNQQITDLKRLQQTTFEELATSRRINKPCNDATHEFDGTNLIPCRESGSAATLSREIRNDMKNSLNPEISTQITISEKKTKIVYNCVRVGVGVLVKDPENPRKVFAGIRRGSHGAGSLALPGGHLEMGEEWETCAKREVLEETGLVITNVKFLHVTNDVMLSEGKHYVTVFMQSDCFGCPRNLEPDKCEGWSSYSWEDLQNGLKSGDTNSSGTLLFGPLKRLVMDNPARLHEFLK